MLLAHKQRLVAIILGVLLLGAVLLKSGLTLESVSDALITILGLALVVVLVGTVAAYVTSVACRLMLSRRRRAGWFLGVIGAVVTGAIIVVFVYQGDLFHPSRWDTGKVNLGVMIPLCFTVSTALGLVPALWVVAHFRSKFKDANRLH